jgi:L-ascorbate oxidase
LLLGNNLKTFVDQSCGVTESAAATATQFEIAVDGLTRREIRPKKVNYLNPGQRSDVLVFFKDPGLYCVLDQDGPGENTVIQGRASKSRRLLALVVVSGGQSITVAPQDYLSKVLAEGNNNLPPAIRTSLAAFDISAFAYFPPGDPSGDLSVAEVTGHPSALFNIHLTPADDQHADMLGRIQNDALGPDPLPYAHDQGYKAILGTVDEWTFGSWKSIPHQDAAAKHVFHIHVNPFQIVDIRHVTGDQPGGVSIFDANHRCIPAEQEAVPLYCDQYHVFRDTMFVHREYLVIARTRYDDYVGKFVIHCHMLEHEDQGMMQNVTVVAPSDGHGSAHKGATSKQ